MGVPEKEETEKERLYNEIMADNLLGLGRHKHSDP
jgi:hypothetical protein